MSTQTKTCTKCGERKELAAYAKLKSGAHGVRSVCRTCTSIYNAQYRAANPDKVKDAARKWREKNPERVRAYNEQWVEDNPEYHTKWRHKKFGTPQPRLHRTKEERDRAYYADNREKIIARATHWNQVNRERSRQHGRDAQAKRRKTAKGRIEDAMSASMRQSLRYGAKGRRKWELLTGYTASDLMAHLERQFKPGMTWENYGEWHIDHIIPKSAFNYETSSDIDFKKCWALENLQPLWKSENIIKGDKLNAPFQPSLALAATDNTPTAHAQAA